MNLKAKISPGKVLSAYYYTLLDITSVGTWLDYSPNLIHSQIPDHNLALQSIDAVYIAHDALSNGKYKYAKKKIRYSLQQADTYRTELSNLLENEIKNRFMKRTTPALLNLTQLLKEPADETWLHLNHQGFSSFTDLNLIRFNGY